MKNLLVPIVLSTTVGVGGVVVAPIVTASVANPSPLMPTPPEAKSFATDDWGTVAYWANEGFETFKQKYQKDYVDNGNTFVGLTKEMTIDGLTYPIMVIDENKDVISGTEKKTALTLQFRNLLTDSKALEPLYLQFGQEPNWKTSSLRTFLQRDFASKIELILGSDIPAVDKPYKVWGKPEEIIGDTVFAPDYAEIGKSARSYAYYADEDPYGKSSRRCIQGFYHEGDFYWTRQPYGGDYHIGICDCGNGLLTSMDIPTDSHPVAPIFNI